MANITSVLRNLRNERQRVARELERLDQAITALGKAAGRNHAGRILARKARPALSAAARRRIAAAQKARWAKWRAKHQKKEA